MRLLLLALVIPVISGQGPSPAAPASRPPDIAFRVQMIDPGFSESVAVADFNRDGRLDILSAEHWYEAPAWTKHRVRDIPFNGQYIDNFSDLPLDVDGDGYTDIVQIAYFARRLVWLKNPGRTRGPWVETEIDAAGPTEFAFLVDLDNDGKALEILPQFTGATGAPLTWYDVQDRKFVRHVVSSRSYGHGIGAGDINGDTRNDIITPAGWLEAPADVRAPGEWTFHPTDWATVPAGPGAPGGAAPAAGRFDPTQPVRMMSRDDAIKAGFVKESAPGKFDMQNGAAMFADGVVMVNESVFQARTQPPARPAEYGFMYVIDINKDGRNDILTTMAHSYGVLWLEQRPDGQWLRRMIDATWANAHASAMADLNEDGQLDLVAAKRYFGRSGNDPSEREPMGIYWYQYRPGPKGTVEWTRHIVDYGGRAGGGLQMVVQDIDGDGDRDIVAAGKTGLFLSENLTKPAAAGARRSAR
jgi:hypothetical protein